MALERGTLPPGSGAQSSSGGHDVGDLFHAQPLQRLSGRPAGLDIPTLQFIEVGRSLEPYLPYLYGLGP